MICKVLFLSVRFRVFMYVSRPMQCVVGLKLFIKIFDLESNDHNLFSKFSNFALFWKKVWNQPLYYFLRSIKKDIKGSVLNIASHSLKKLPNLEEKSNKYIWLEMNITSILVILFITQVCSVNGLKCTLRRCNQCATVFTEQMGTMQQQHFCGDYIETHCCRIMKSSSVRRLF